VHEVTGSSERFSAVLMQDSVATAYMQPYQPCWPSKESLLHSQDHQPVRPFSRITLAST